MKSKEEILDTYNLPFEHYGQCNLNAMDEYAKEVAIGLLEFIKYDFSHSFLLDKWISLETHEEITSESLFNIFKKEMDER